MNDSSEPRSIRDYLRVLRGHRTLIAVITLVAAGAALAYSLAKAPTYAARASLNFKDESQDLSLSGVPAPASDPAKLAAAGAQTVTRPAVIARARKNLGMREPVGELQNAVSASVDPASNLVVVEASWGSAASAARLANAVAREAEHLATLEDRQRYRAAAHRLQLTSKSNSGPADQLNRQLQRERISRLLSLSAFAQPVQIERLASVPDSPASPKPFRDTILAAMLGLICGCIVAFARDAFDQRLRTAHEISQQVDLPLVGFVRTEALGITMPSQNGHATIADEELEAFRILRSNLEFLHGERLPRLVVVTSPMAEEGKSTVAAWLACASAFAGKTTLLLDSDLRRPVLAERLGAAAAPGLTDYLTGQANLQDTLQVIELELERPLVASSNGQPGDPGPAGEAQLVFMSSGGRVVQAGEFLGSERFSEFLAQASRYYELIVLDAPPLLPVVDTLELLPQVDTVLLCIRLGQTTRDQASAAMAVLQHFPSRPAGLVVTGAEPGAGGYYGYYSYGRAGAGAAGSLVGGGGGD